MLNNDALAQLKGLKQQIEAQKEYAEATVKGTQNRYGFAVVDDGREVFLPPDEMLKVLPGDRVKICIRPAAEKGGGKGKAGKSKDGRTVADVESLITTSLDRFVGKVVTKGKAVFVDPDLPDLNRWLFIPPHARNGVKAGDRVECGLMRHPIKDGKPSAKVLAVLGKEGEPGLENRYCAARASIAWEWPEKEAARWVNFASQRDPLTDSQRTDLTHLNFVSIDAARTQDIDDALFAEVINDGWLLYVAVADPTAYLDGLEDLDQILGERGASVYFHGDAIPMLPEAIGRDFCALAEEQTRPALVCKVQISDDGKVGDYEFLNATVRSRAKLTYAAVDRYVTGHNDQLIAWSNPLEALVQAYRALRRRREQHELVMEDRREFRWLLDEQRQIGTIETHEKLASQHLVEECMIAANRCAAHCLALSEATGPFVVHPGFRADRAQETQQFLKRFLPELAETNVTTLAGYQTVFKALNVEHELPLRGMVNRLLTRAVFNTAPAEHMGMALSAYTNFTSPLRKYLDFMTHRQIKRVIAGEPATAVTDDQLSNASRAIARAREASLAAERWLAGNFLDRAKTQGHTDYQGEVCHVTSAGFNVRLSDTGLEGHVDLRKDPEKFSFDKWTASLTSTTRRVQLQQHIEVRYLETPDPGSGKLPEFELLPGSALKPVKSQSDIIQEH